MTLAIVFTDVVGSTALGHEVGDAEMNDVRRAHFAQGQKLLDQHHGREIKTIGDSFMAAFKSVEEALDFALALQSKPGHPKIQVRAGIHVGVMQVEGNDVFGGTVNFAARVVGAIKEAEIWLSERAKEDIVALKASRHRSLKWQQQDGVVMKGFPGTFTLWALRDQATSINDSNDENPPDATKETIPMATTFKYDALISYRRREPDKTFARELLKRLEAVGLKVAIDERDFDPAATFLEEMERCIKESRFTLAVASPKYFESGNCVEEAIICKVLDMAERRRRTIPLIIESVTMPTWLYNIVGINFTDLNPLVDPHDKLIGKLRNPDTNSRSQVPAVAPQVGTQATTIASSRTALPPSGFKGAGVGFTLAKEERELIDAVCAADASMQFIEYVKSEGGDAIHAGGKIFSGLRYPSAFEELRQKGLLIARGNDTFGVNVLKLGDLASPNP